MSAQRAGPAPQHAGLRTCTRATSSAAFAQADRVFEHTFTTPRYHGGYIEPRATMVWIDDAGVVHVDLDATSRRSLARHDSRVTTGLPKEKIVVEPSFIGGDFGAKGLSIEEFPCYYLAAATKRPVKYVRTYLDDIRSTNVRHASKITRAAPASTKDGKIVALDVRVALRRRRVRGRRRSIPDAPARAGARSCPTRIPNAPARTHRRSYTNTIPGRLRARARRRADPLRARVAHRHDRARSGIDPLELRLRNAARDGDPDIEGHPFLDPRAARGARARCARAEWDAPLQAGRGRGIALTARHIGGGQHQRHARARCRRRLEVRHRDDRAGRRAS